VTSLGNELQSTTISTTNEVAQLTSFNDTVGSESTTTLSIPDLYSVVDPYPSQGLESVLSRPYTTTYTWNAAAAQGTKLFELDFPYHMFNSFTNLTEKLSRFQYFHAKTHVEIRINGTMMHYGQLLIVYLPHYNASIGDADYGPFSDLHGASVCPHVLVFPNTSETVSFEISYVNPAPFVNLSHIVAPGKGEFGHIACFVLNPLKSSSQATAPQITVSVTCRFLDPKVAGPTTYSIATAYRFDNNNNNNNNNTRH
jgi:hypothetical protein